VKNTLNYNEIPWKKFYNDQIPENFNFEEINLCSYLEKTCKKFPDNIALIFEGYKVTYKELLEMVNILASNLYHFGIRKGDTVAILLPNTIPCVVSYYAIAKIGGVAAMNNPLYSDRELKYQFNDSNAKILITLDIYANRMIDLRSETQIKQIIYTSITDYLPAAKKIVINSIGKTKNNYLLDEIIPDNEITFPIVSNLINPLIKVKQKILKIQNLTKIVKNAKHVYEWKELLSTYRPYISNIEINFDDTIQLQYTGGTTGVSKGVILTHKNMSVQLQQVSIWFSDLIDGKETVLGALPFFHVFGLTTVMNFSIFKGWTNILVSKPHAKNLLNAINLYKPTFAPLLPTMFIKILNHPDIVNIDMTSIKACFSGSAPLPVDVIHKFEELSGAVIIEGFGMTESSPVTHMNPFGSIRKVGSIGIPLPATQCRIVDFETGTKDIPVGEAGELIVKGPQIMKSYLNNPEETNNTIRDGWLYSGDIATMDEDGFFYIIDRKKDMIISGGYNVYPKDIDDVLYQNQKIKETCSIGIPHPDKGEAIKSFIVLKENQTASEEEIIEFCKQRLAQYKIPIEIEFREDLPKSNVGKILRKNLRAEEVIKRKTLLKI